MHLSYIKDVHVYTYLHFRAYVVVKSDRLVKGDFYSCKIKVYLDFSTVLNPALHLFC